MTSYRLFALPAFVALVALGAVYGWGGAAALTTALFLVTLEVVLSFDNAVVNAKVLARMSEVWRRRFLTWGILIAVVGTRLVLPIVIVAASAAASPLLVARLAFADPARYQALLAGAHYVVNGFGGFFLLMVALQYFFDAEKEVHWIHQVERSLARWGQVEAIEILIALAALFSLTLALAPGVRAGLFVSGLVGIVLFTLIRGILGALSAEAVATAGRGLALFVYLNVLDSAFSLDGVVGAFALTDEVALIAVGLGVGAIFVRTLTVYLVRERTLDTLLYLEHGAHWAIFGLAVAMLAELFVSVPEAVIALMGAAFVLASYASSLRERRRVAG